MGTMQSFVGGGGGVVVVVVVLVLWLCNRLMTVRNEEWRRGQRSTHKNQQNNKNKQLFSLEQNKEEEWFG